MSTSRKEEDVKPKGFTVGDFFSHARPQGVIRMVVVGHTLHFGFDARYLIDVVNDHMARIGVDGFGKVPPVPGTIKPEDVADLVKLARHPMMHVKISAFYALGRRTPPYDDMIPLIRDRLDGVSVADREWLLRKTAERVFFS
jgi:hypothetical protein